MRSDARTHQYSRISSPAHSGSRISPRGRKPFITGLMSSTGVPSMASRPRTRTVRPFTATTEDGVAMAIEHKTLPVGGVQFHPESLMSLGGEVGLRIVENAFRLKAN